MFVPHPVLLISNTSPPTLRKSRTSGLHNGKHEQLRLFHHKHKEGLVRNPAEVAGGQVGLQLE